MTDSLTAEQNARGIVEKIQTRTMLYRDIELLRTGYKELAQGYHHMCNICQPTRHQSMNWLDCDEQSCKENKKFIEKL